MTQLKNLQKAFDEFKVLRSKYNFDINSDNQAHWLLRHMDDIFKNYEVRAEAIEKYRKAMNIQLEENDAGSWSDNF